ncbi:MAG: MFS transporter [Lentisphaeria bacterium]|nr:MFS transporter [Lentisphaeria bacterium]
MKKLNFGRYDAACLAAFIGYALCSLSIPIALVAMGKDLNFPLDRGGMAAGGILHLTRSIAIVTALLVCGLIAARIGKRKSMGLSVLLMGSGILLCSLAPAYGFILPLLLIAGFGEGICEGIATPFIQDLHADAPERYVNISHSYWSIGIGICVLGAGGLLSLGISWRFVLALAGALTMAAAPLFLWKENPRKKYPELQTASNMTEIRQLSGKIFKTPRFWLHCLAMFMGAGAEYCLTFWSAAYLQLTFQTTAWTAGLGTAAIGLGMFIGRNFFGLIARENNLKRNLILAAGGTIPLILILACISPEFIPSKELFFILLLTVLTFCGIGIAPFWPTLQVYSVQQMRELDSTLMYIYLSSTGIPGCGFFTWLIGVLGDRFGLRGALFLLPITLIFYILILLLDSRLYAAEKPVKSPFQTTPS